MEFNAWWNTGKVPETLLEAHKRPYFDKILEYLKDRQIILIYGLRRVGKTTIIYQLIDHLLKNGENPKNIIYYSFDETSADLSKVLSDYQAKILGKDYQDEKRIYVLLDEIQKCADWQNIIKKHYDLYPNMKFIITGSASISVEKKAKESLAGRIYDFLIEPASMQEYANYKLIQKKILLNEINKLRTASLKVSELKKYEHLEKEMLPVFYDYIKKGGFLEISDEPDEIKIKQYLKNSLIEKIIFKDLPEYFQLKEPLLLRKLIEIISSKPGMIINYEAMGNDLAKDRRTIQEYIEYLEFGLLIRKIYSYSRNVLTSEKKMKKVYPASSCLSFAFQVPFNIDDGNLIETLILADLKTKFYWRTPQKDEVDFVIPAKEPIPIEVKYKENINKQDKKGLMKFMKKYGVGRGIMVSKRTLKEEEIEGRTIIIVPAWLFLLVNHEW